jgi:hypothetical protein
MYGNGEALVCIHTGVRNTAPALGPQGCILAKKVSNKKCDDYRVAVTIGTLKPEIFHLTPLLGPQSAETGF